MTDVLNPSSEPKPRVSFAAQRVALARRQAVVAWAAALLLSLAVAALAGFPLWTAYQDDPKHFMNREAIQWLGLAVAMVVLVVMSTRSHTRQLLRLSLQAAVIDRQNTNLRTTEAQLRQEIREREQAESQRDSFFNLSADMLAILDFDGRFVRINPAFSSILGEGEESLRGVELASFFHAGDIDALRNVIETIEEDGKSKSLEARCQTHTKGWRWFLWTLVARQGHVFAVAHDFTDHRAASEALREAKESAERASEVKTRFLANMSHELRTPLNAVIGFSESLEMGIHGSLNEKQLEYVRDIHGAGHHLLGIVADLLDLSVVDSGAMRLTETRFAPHTLVEATLALVRKRADEAGIILTSDVPDGLPRLNADVGKLRQVLVNLVTNAIKFTPKCGRVTVTVERLSDGVAITVSDTGIGIKAIDIPTVLAPFGRLQSAYAGADGGVGLGLPLARRLTELHQGTLTITSEPGQGTAVRLWLPEARILKENRP